MVTAPFDVLVAAVPGNVGQLGSHPVIRNRGADSGWNQRCRLRGNPGPRKQNGPRAAVRFFRIGSGGLLPIQAIPLDRAKII